MADPTVVDQLRSILERVVAATPNAPVAPPAAPPVPPPLPQDAAVIDRFQQILSAGPSAASRLPKNDAMPQKPMTPVRAGSIDVPIPARRPGDYPLAAGFDPAAKGAADQSAREFVADVAPIAAPLAVGPALSAVKKGVDIARPIVAPYLERAGRALAHPAGKATSAASAAVAGGTVAAPQVGIGSDLPQAPNADRLQQMLTQRNSLDQQRTLAQQERDAQAKGKGGRLKGTGPIYEARDADVQRLTNEIGALDTMIEQEQRLRDPEYQRQLGLKQQEDERQRKIKDANTSIRELYPEYTQFIPALTVALGGGIGSLVKRAYMRGHNTRIADVTTRWQDTIRQGNEAVARGDKVTAKRLAEQAENLGRQHDELTSRVGTLWQQALARLRGQNKSKVGGTKETIVGGLAAGELVGLAADEIDFARAIPGSKLREESLKGLTDPERWAVSALLGLAPAELGSLTAAALMRQPSRGFWAETENLGAAARARGPRTPAAQPRPRRTRKPKPAND